ncbi:hypothetical protein B0H14DRAFT_1278723 [Mycena olivaceomarginata]|nr:hypothetical protein B0H14DRAFT_1278723 [Mycena olivaceomarginata]
MKPAILLQLFVSNMVNLPPGTQALLLIKEEDCETVQIRTHGMSLTPALQSQLDATFGELFAGSLEKTEEGNWDDDADDDDDLGDNREAAFEEELECRIEGEDDGQNSIEDDNGDEDEDVPGEEEEERRSETEIVELLGSLSIQDLRAPTFLSLQYRRRSRRAARRCKRGS